MHSLYCRMYGWFCYLNHANQEHPTSMIITPLSSSSVCCVCVRVGVHVCAAMILVCHPRSLLPYKKDLYTYYTDF